MVVVNRPGTPKLWSISHGNDHKKQKRRIFIIPLKYVNRLGTLILWAITHANGQKTRKCRVFGNNSQTCIRSDEPCKSSGTPKLWTIAHKNGHRTRKQRVLGHALKHVSGLTIVVNLRL